MSLHVIKTEIERFITSSEPEVMAICGDWGIGKTFAWKSIVKNNQDKVALERYSYISLFGVNNIADLEAAIFRSMVNKNDIGEEPGIETFKDNISAIFSGNADGHLLTRLWRWGKKNSRYIKKIPKISEFSGLIDAISFLYVKDAIICIDDLERKGKELDVQALLGLISMLKEQRSCKIVLIFNNNELGENLEEYKRFREKVIDIEIKFNAMPEESVSLIFASDDPLKNKIESFVKILGITNIRILKKIERLARELYQKLSIYDSNVFHQAIHSLVLFSWAFFSKSENVPDFDFIENTNVASVYAQSGENKKEDEWNSILREYEFLSADSFDLIIAEGVKQGYFNNDSLQEEAKKLDNQIKNGQSEADFRKAWGIYHNSFSDNSEEVIEALKNSFYKNYLVITPVSLSAITCLFRDLDRKEMADEMIDFYIKNRREEKSLFLLESYASYPEIKDKKLIEKFKVIADQQQKSKSLKETLISIADTKICQREDEVKLVEATIDDYVDLFKSINDKSLDKMIRTGLGLGQSKYASENFKMISDSIKKALEKIGHENKINASRILKYGIKINE